MYMSGFASFIWYKTKPACINLFFEEWTLDNRVKFAFGVLGAFTLALLTEFCTKVRRLIHRHVAFSRTQLGAVCMACL
jgi:hypothetical protein